MHVKRKLKKWAQDMHRYFRKEVKMVINPEKMFALINNPGYAC